MKKKPPAFFIVLCTVLLFSFTANVWAAAGESELERQMLELVNGERAAAGLEPLQMDSRLVELARLKSQDMIEKNYFSHTSPTYGDPFTMMKDYEIGYLTAGENLAGNPSLTGAHEALMESPGHRANILKPEFTHIGIGVVKGGKYGLMITQMFIKNPVGNTGINNNSQGPVGEPAEEITGDEEFPSADLRIVFNEKEVSFPDVKPYINRQDRIMVPLRFISQDMGYAVDWEDRDQKIVIHNQANTMNLWIGKTLVLKNNQTLVSDSQPELSDGRTLVPLRFVSELLGCDVNWYPLLHKVTIN
ncbi:MAG: stalk domain-containing protein [Peptococcaceae bacterium]